MCAVVFAAGEKEEATMQSLSSLLTFPISSSSHQSNAERTPLSPPSTHIVSTATQPAPSSFLPLHYARLFLAASRPVVWVCCDAAGKAHWRALLRKATGASAAFLEAHWHFVDATAGDAFDGRPSARLKRLHDAVEATIQKACPAVSSKPLPSSSLKSRTWEQASALVVLDDAAALAWALDSTAEDWIEEDEEEQAPSQDQSDGRLELLRRSGKKGGVKEDATGKGVARWIEGLAQLCAEYDCALTTHMTVENTTIIAPSLSNPHSSSRGGHGVGTGFDADDAGEEDDEDLVFEDIDEEIESAPAAAHEDASTVETKTKVITASSSLPPDDTIDWRVDSLLRVLLASADFWIEVRGLRSGKARDCHGEVSLQPFLSS